MYWLWSWRIICNEQNFTEKLKLLLNILECDGKPILKFTLSDVFTILKINFIFVEYILRIISKSFTYITLKHLIEKLIKFILSIAIGLLFALSNSIHDVSDLIVIISYWRRYSLHIVWNIIQGVCWIKLIN